ncbi:MAG: NifB/NifX family molybdenum-iron cluster-binding protein [Desulfobacterales bacterium]|nr:NifB/NifX family molybdenum-iron cluster-binding protein [Desulfobacterales bacterium]
MSTIAVSSEGPDLDARVDPRFGRAAGFIVLDPHTMVFDYIDNGASQIRAQGAGIQAAEIVADAGAKTVLTGFLGPKAFKALRAAGVGVVQKVDGLTVREAAIRFASGMLPLDQAPSHRQARR